MLIPLEYVIGYFNGSIYFFLLANQKEILQKKKKNKKKFKSAEKIMRGAGIEFFFS